MPLHEKKTITKNLKKTKIKTIGRHDPCVGIRATPIAEAMVALVVLDHALLGRLVGHVAVGSEEQTTCTAMGRGGREVGRAQVPLGSEIKTPATKVQAEPELAADPEIYFMYKQLMKTYGKDFWKTLCTNFLILHKFRWIIDNTFVQIYKTLNIDPSEHWAEI